MSRKLIIGIFAILLLGIVGGGVILVWQKFTGSDGEGVEVVGEGEGSLFGALPEAKEGEKQETPEVVAVSQDDDKDGLSNEEELLWGTNANNPDTDGDGYLDGEEVVANHDPNKPAPDDLLAIAKEVSEVVTPKLVQNELTIENTSKYFSEDLDLSGGTNNLTKEYEKEYAEADRSPGTMKDYASKISIISQLPQPNKSEIPETVENSISAIKVYLRTADNENALANSSTYNIAQTNLVSMGDPALMLSLANTLSLYENDLRRVAVPEAALPVHVILLSYSELLATTFNQIALQGEDPVRSMVASRQLDAIDHKYYPIIRRELRRLEALQ